MQLDGEQMDNVSSAIVLQLMMNLRLKFAVWGFVFQEGFKEAMSHNNYLDIRIKCVFIVKKKICKK